MKFYARIICILGLIFFISFNSAGIEFPRIRRKHEGKVKDTEIGKTSSKCEFDCKASGHICCQLSDGIQECRKDKNCPKLEPNSTLPNSRNCPIACPYCCDDDTCGPDEQKYCNECCPFSAKEQVIKSFTKSCPEGKCICKGYPRITTNEALLTGKVTLDQCRDACYKNHLCFGFEFWGEDRTWASPNCLICGTDPGMKKVVEVVAMKGNTNYATVYLKKFLGSEEWTCGNENESCGANKACCKNLRCKKGKCMPHKECFPNSKGQFKCPRGWYCSGLTGTCRICSAHHYREHTACKNNYLGGACNAADRAIRKEKTDEVIQETARECSETSTYGCIRDCLARCMRKGLGFSQPCADCMGDGATCAYNNCYWTSCIRYGKDSHECKKCIEKKCRPDFIKCSGFSFPTTDIANLIMEVKPGPKPKPFPKSKDTSPAPNPSNR